MTQSLISNKYELSYITGDLNKIKLSGVKLEDNIFLEEIIDKITATKEDSKKVLQVEHIWEILDLIPHILSSEIAEIQDNVNNITDLQQDSFKNILPKTINNKIKPSAFIEDSVKLGNNVEIGHNVVIEGNVTIGDNVKILPGCIITGPVTIGRNVKIEKLSIIENNTVINDNVSIGKRNILSHSLIDEYVKTFTGAEINDSYIGKHSIVGSQVAIRDSNIGTNSVIGHQSEIVRSRLGDHVETHNAYIGDSFIGDYVHFAGKSGTANLRLDKKSIKLDIQDDGAFTHTILDTNRKKLGIITGNHIEIGAGVEFMPGLLIGSNIEIASKTTVTKNITNNTFVKNQKVSTSISNVGRRSQAN